ncbi:hypothetical protein [Odoribacter splanchnicus]|uniref:hypothetical protein n=2 Tax=Odoribacter splanchnicus TaxID=28118 RepID=UPI0034A43C6D
MMHLSFRFSACCRCWRWRTRGVLKEIREMTGQENGQISPYLKMMTDQKIVERMAKKQRGAKYRIIDLLFRLWLNRNVV